MICVDDAKERLDRFSYDRRIHVDIYDSLGCVLAEDIISDIDVPSFDRSEMDGYAIKNLNGRRFKLIAEMFAGDDQEMMVGDGECIWVATGAKIPVGANLVIPVEKTQRIKDDVIVYESGRESHITRKGCDIQHGERILNSGCILHERNIGIIATLGVRNILIYDTPKVGILSTGDELSRINDVNSLTLCAIVKQSGCSPVFLGTATDDIELIKKKIVEAMKYDVILTSGGISSGKKDLMPIIVSEMGEVLFHTVKMRPGMPMLAGIIDGKPILCMPGNVTSCLVCAHVFLFPMLRKMAHIPFTKKIIRARISDKASSEYGMRQYLPVKLTDGVAYPTFKGSGLITSIALADGLVEIKENETLTQGEVKVWVF
jgi:molybdopterin molybdotransferase